MPFISKEQLNSIRDSERLNGRNMGFSEGLDAGYADGYKKGLTDGRGGLYCLDVLDLVIDQFHIRDQYPNTVSKTTLSVGDLSRAGDSVVRLSGAQRFYEDLQAAAEFNTKADAAERIALAADRASSLNGEDFE